jgi:hypothetical protein
LVNTSISRKDNEISVYRGSLTDSNIVIELAKAKIAFPALPVDFFNMLSDRLKANGFTDDRLRDAVDHVIDTCLYPTPTIANFISFDKKIKLYTYDEYCKFCAEGVGGNYQPIKFPDRPKPVWIHVNDIAQYKIK